jgi:hypothetical protein
MFKASLLWRPACVVVLTTLVVTTLTQSSLLLSYANTAAPPPAQFSPVTLSGSWINQSGITLADLDGNNTLEIVFGGRTVTDGVQTLGCTGKVYAYNSNGSLKWETTVRADVNSTPAVADLNGDGVKDVVVGMGGWIVDGATKDDLQYDCDGGLIALNGQNGNPLWTFDTDDHGEWDGANGRLDGVYSSPAIADIDGNGVLDIVFGAWDQCIYRLDEDGNPLWNSLPDTEGHCRDDSGFWNRDTVWGSPALADLTGDGKLEIVIGSDITIGGPEGYLNVLDYNGSVLARRQFPQVFFSSPAIADLDDDGVLNIVIGSGGIGNGDPAGHYVVFAHYDASQLTESDRIVIDWQPTTVGKVFASPSVGDINGDGYLDATVQAFQGETFPNWPMHGYAFDFKNKTVLFDQWLCDGDVTTDNAYKGLMYGSPLIADVAGDSKPEILFTMKRDVIILNPDGTYYTHTGNTSCSGGVTPTSNYNLTTNGGLYGTPAVGDLDGDGDNEIVAASYWNENSLYTDDPDDLRGGLFAWTGFKKAKSPWPMYRHDEQHTGSIVKILLTPELHLSATFVAFLMESTDSDTDTRRVYISNSGGGGSIQWTASPSSGQTWLVASPTSGSTESDPYVTLTADKSGLAMGTYTADVTVQATTPGVENPNQTINVSLYIGPLHKVFAPGLLRNHPPSAFIAADM